jgi:multiple RNA-binding domain-containing protein 1
MDVMQPRNKQGRSWANEAPPDEDTIMADPSSASQSTKPSKKDKRKGSTNAEDGPDSNEGRAEGMSDLDWMKSRMRRGIEESKDDKVFHQSDEEDDAMEEDSIVDERQAVPPQPSDEDQTREAILATSRLFLRNLAFTCTNSDLEEAFKPFGDISQVSAQFFFWFPPGLLRLDRRDFL